jgi:hypothetical protein
LDQENLGIEFLQRPNQFKKIAKDVAAGNQHPNQPQPKPTVFAHKAVGKSKDQSIDNKRVDLSPQKQWMVEQNTFGNRQ